MNVSSYIKEENPELAKFLVEELKNVPDCRYPTDINYIPTKDELKEFTDDELTDILMDASLEADISVDKEDCAFLTNRYEMIKKLVSEERSNRKNEIQVS